MRSPKVRLALAVSLVLLIAGAMSTAAMGGTQNHSTRSKTTTTKTLQPSPSLGLTVPDVECGGACGGGGDIPKCTATASLTIETAEGDVDGNATAEGDVQCNYTPSKLTISVCLQLYEFGEWGNAGCTPNKTVYNQSWIIGTPAIIGCPEDSKWRTSIGYLAAALPNSGYGPIAGQVYTDDKDC